MPELDQKVRRRIESFIAQDERPGRDTVILCGSYATGKATPSSDIDLCYIGDFDGFNRESHRLQGIEFQLMIAPWSCNEDVIQSYERKGNIGTITTMLANGLCITGCSTRWQELQQQARMFYQKGPSEISQDDIRRHRTRVTDLWKDFEDSVTASQRKWLALHLVQACIEGHFAIRRWWAVKPKSQLEELASKDSMMAGMVG